MRRTLAGGGFIVIAAGAALCQQSAGQPAFDIADIHLSPRTDWSKTVANWMQGGTLAADRYQLRRATMLDLIRTAYNVDANKVSGGPAWLDYDRYEVVAKTKPGTRPATLRLMLQTLLADRFHLVVQTDTQPVPGYILSTGKGELKMRPAADSAESGGCQNNFLREAGVSYENFQCRNMTMAEFAAFLHRSGSAAVMDSTGIDGAWDFELKYASASLGAGFPGPGVIEALEKLGLKLEPGKVPQSVLTVASVDENPSPNPPGVAEALPPLPAPQFEVASIRLCNGGCRMSSTPQFQPGGRVVAEGIGPAFLVTEAWNVQLEQVAMPQWAAGNTSRNVTIVAKAPAGVSQDRDNLHAMLRALLIDRYKLAVHYEDRPMDTSTLVATKPKLKKADPSGRTGCARQIEIVPGQGATHHLDCRNMTMAQFAEQIPAYKIDIYYPVLDGTGIDGAWDFTVDYDTFFGRARGPAAGPGDGAVPEASDPSGSVPFADAIQKQLGLKLEVHKRPQPVLVIDHMEEFPTEN